MDGDGSETAVSIHLGVDIVCLVELVAPETACKGIIHVCTYAEAVHLCQLCAEVRTGGTDGTVTDGRGAFLAHGGVEGVVGAVGDAKELIRGDEETDVGGNGVSFTADLDGSPLKYEFKGNRILFHGGDEDEAAFHNGHVSVGEGHADCTVVDYVVTEDTVDDFRGGVFICLDIKGTGAGGDVLVYFTGEIDVLSVFHLAVFGCSKSKLCDRQHASENYTEFFHGKSLWLFVQI